MKTVNDIIQNNEDIKDEVIQMKKTETKEEVNNNNKEAKKGKHRESARSAIWPIWRRSVKEKRSTVRSYNNSEKQGYSGWETVSTLLKQRLKKK